ncbi:DUF4115 domain-containing protein, partial [Carnobacterium sp.]|uniref:DUF4115 domain-containing protein n=1 Tax=Carnobacterium sp. TaxID=48221 RepID=UPI0028A6969B
LNGDQLLEEYTDTVPHTHDEEYVEKVSSSQTRSGNKTGNELLTKVRDYLPTLIILLVVIVIAVAIYFAFIKTNQATTESMITKSTESVVVSSAVSEPEKSSESESKESAASEEKEEKQTVSVVSSTGSQTTYAVEGATTNNVITLNAEGGDSWVSVEADGVMLDQALLTNGDAMNADIPADTEQVNIVVGNAAVTVVKLNDKQVDYAPEAANAVTQKIEFQFKKTE